MYTVKALTKAELCAELVIVIYHNNYKATHSKAHASSQQGQIYVRLKTQGV